MDPDSRRHGPDRKPLVAGLLTVLVTGLGHVYTGNARRGLAAFGSLLAVGVLWAMLSVRVDTPFLRLISYPLIPVIWVAIVADAIGLARKAERPYRLKGYNRPVVYAGLAAFALMFLQPLLLSHIRQRVARAYVIPGGLMSPALQPGDYILSAPFGAHAVDHGEVVVFRENGADFVLRAVGLPGDTIEMRAKSLYRNGLELTESYVRHIDPDSDARDPSMLWQMDFMLASAGPDALPSRDNWGPIAIPAERYLLLGDNRDNSYDGRYRGFAHADQIVGRPAWIYFSRDSETGEIRWHRIGSSVR